jgi:hypothetical protein
METQALTVDLVLWRHETVSFERRSGSLAAQLDGECGAGLPVRKGKVVMKGMRLRPPSPAIVLVQGVGMDGELP